MKAVVLMKCPVCGKFPVADQKSVGTGWIAEMRCPGIFRKPHISVSVSADMTLDLASECASAWNSAVEEFSHEKNV